MDGIAGRVAEVWRYPVKSMGGERLESGEVSARGLEHDRRWAVVAPDGRLGSGKTSRRFVRMPGLLGLAAAMEGDRPIVTFPDGERLDAEEPGAWARVSDIVGVDVRILEEDATPHFDAAPVHLVSDVSLAWFAARHPDAAVERRRFRPNVVVATDGAGDEDDWMGRSLSVGAATLEVVARTERCVMITMAQPGLAREPHLLKDLTRVADACLGVYASVAAGGPLAVGDAVGAAR